MKKFLDSILNIIAMILDIFPVFLLILNLCIPIGMLFLLIPSEIIDRIFHVNFGASHKWVYFLLSTILGIIYFALIFIFDNKKSLKKYTLIMFILGFPLVYIFGKPDKGTTTLESPSANYQTHSSYNTHSSSNYYRSDSETYEPSEKISANSNTRSNLTYNHPDSSSYNYSDKMSEDKNIQREAKTVSSSKNVLYERWEYVTDDEQGNKYYINVNLPVSVYGSRLNGAIFTAQFKKVYSDMGRNEVLNELRLYYQKELPEMLRDLSYTKMTVSFTETNGVRKKYFSDIAEYTSNNAIILSWESHQRKFEWEKISDEVYNALFDAAYSHL